MATLRLGLQATFREKLEWLEEAETLNLNLRAARERREKAAAEAPPSDSAS